MLAFYRFIKPSLPIVVLSLAIILTSSGCDRGILVPGKGSSGLAFFVLSELPADNYDRYIFGMKPLTENATLVEKKLYYRSGRNIDLNLRPGVYKVTLDYLNETKIVYSTSFCEQDTSQIILKTGNNDTELTVCDENKKPYSVNIIIRPEIVVETNVDTFDEVYGESISRKTSWYVLDGDIFYSGEKVKLKGLNWFGFDTDKLGLHGLWSGRSLKSFLDQIKLLGFNALRIPLSPQALDENQQGSDGYKSPVDQLRDLMQKADSLGLYLVFDFHNCHYSIGHTQGRPDQHPACPSYNESSWLSDLKALAKLIKGHPSVVGIDLFNEPYELSWPQWKQFVNAGAKSVLSENPHVLVFVEGVGGSADQAGGFQAFWGENLVDALRDPVDVPLSRLVFAPHVYGPSVYEQDYFSDANFPANLDQIWDTHFGFLVGKGYPLAIGEFGGKYTKFSDGRDVEWQRQFVQYLEKRSIDHFFYWSLNSNSADTNGILESDWLTFDQDKMDLLKPLLTSH